MPPPYAPYMQAQTRIRIFKEGTFLRPWVGGRATEFFPLYGGRGEYQMGSDVSDSLLGSFSDLERIKDDIGNFVNHVRSGGVLGVISAIGDAHDLYNHFERFVTTFGDGKLAADSRELELPFPSPDFDLMQVSFDAFLPHDDFDEGEDHGFPFSPQVGLHTPGVRLSDGPRGTRFAGIDNSKTVTLEVHPDELAALAGDAIYDAPICFGFGCRIGRWPGDLAIQHLLKLHFRRPTRPFLKSITPSAARLNDTIVLNGEHFFGTRAVLLNGSPAEFVTLNDSRLDVTVPALPGVFDTATISVQTPGGASLNGGIVTLALQFPIADLQFKQDEIAAGDILEIEGRHLQGTTDITFLPARGAAVPAGTVQEFPATWREKIEIIADTGLKRERLFVGVPYGLPELVNVRITTTADTTTAGSLVFTPGPPVISAVNLIVDPHSSIVTGSRQVLVTGTNLHYSPHVWFGDNEMEVLEVGLGRLVFSLPLGLTAGHVIVHTSFGSTLTPAVATFPAVHPPPS